MSTLYLIATPIGNLADITYRALEVLGQVDALACEDTRRTRILLEKYQIPRPRLVFCCHEHNEHRVADKILRLLGDGCAVAQCSNAGLPGISDPGYTVVSRAIAEGYSVEVIPGPTAVTTAVVVSGLPTSSFSFKGFAPRKPGRLREFIAVDAASPHTLVLFESALRLQKLLACALEILGDRRAAICVELTKKFERVRRGFITDLLQELEEQPLKGEVTVVIAGKHPKFVRPSPEMLG